MRLFLLGLALLFSRAALSQPNSRRLFGAAETAVADAQDAVRQAPPQCRAALFTQLDELDESVAELWDDGFDSGVQQLRTQLTALAQTGALAGCPPQVVDRLARAGDALEDGRAALWQRHRRRPKEVDGTQWASFATLSPLQVTANSVFGGGPAARVVVPELRFEGMQGRHFYLGVRSRSLSGDWSDWVTTQVWRVPSDPFAWRNALNHFIPHSALAEDDVSGGRFVVHVSVFDGQSGQQLAFREMSFRVALKRVSPTPPAPPSARDCGVSVNDLGCSMSRNGQLPMDATAFMGVRHAVMHTPNELMRLSLLNAMMERSLLTAEQLGVLLRSWSTDQARLQVTTTLASRVVNPQHAMSFASLFGNALLGSQFVQVMRAQRPGEF